MRSRAARFVPTPVPSHSLPDAAVKASDGLRLALVITLVATLGRLAVAATLPVGVDEAYSIGIARQLSLSYFDHPPLHLWLVGLWAKLVGTEELFVLRLPFVALSAVSTLMLFALGRRLFSPAAGVWAAALFNVTLVFGVAHGTLILPDGPLLAAALGAAYVVSRILYDPLPGDQLGRWALAGLLAGLALLSKYHGVLLIAGLFIFLLTTPHRKLLLRPGPWLAGIIALVLLAPVLVWNLQHDWASFRFQSGRGGWGGELRPLGMVESLVFQSIYLLPWIALGLILVLLWALARGPWRERRWYLACLAILPIAIFTGLTLYQRGLPHWQMPGWVFVLPLLGEALSKLPRVLRWLAATVVLASGLLLGGLATVTTLQARTGQFDDTVQSLLGSDPTTSLMPWDGIRDVLAAQGLPTDDRTFIAAFNWIRAAQLNRLFGKDIPVLCLCGDARHFRYLNRPSDFAGWTGLLIDSPSAIADDARQLQRFTSLEPPVDASLTKNNRVVTGLSLRVGHDFQPQD